MIKQSMADALNRQINNEFFSAYLYLGMSGYCASRGLRGAASWLMAKYREEQLHAMKIYRYVLDQGAVVELQAVARPAQEFAGLIDVLEKTLTHERGVTESINAMMDVAVAERDHASQVFLQWFVTEQIEEEAVVGDILNRLRLVGGQGEGLFLIDNELERQAAAMAQASQATVG